MMIFPSSWLIVTPRPAARLRLYCFAYAGGSAGAFSSWQKELGPDVEVCAVQLPGRGARHSEPLLTSLPTLVAQLGQVLSAQPQKPFAFFGHSLGGLVAFELTRFFARHLMPLPSRLIVSGCDAPQHRQPSKNLHVMPDGELIEALGKYNGSPPEVLAHRELMELLLPMIRADFSLAENYAYRPTPRLPVPITVFAGKLDDHLSLDEVLEWRKETSSHFRVQWFEGDHFFIHSEKDLVLECLHAELAEPPEPYPERALAINQHPELPKHADETGEQSSAVASTRTSALAADELPAQTSTSDACLDTPLHTGMSADTAI